MSRSLRKSLLLTIALAVWFDPGSRPVSAEPLPVAQIRTLTEANFDAAVALYREFLSLPNDANFPDDIARLVDWMEPAFAARGFVD